MLFICFKLSRIHSCFPPPPTPVLLGIDKLTLTITVNEMHFKRLSLTFVITRIYIPLALSESKKKPTTSYTFSNLLSSIYYMQQVPCLITTHYNYVLFTITHEKKRRRRLHRTKGKEHGGGYEDLRIKNLKQLLLLRKLCAL